MSYVVSLVPTVSTRTLAAIRDRLGIYKPRGFGSPRRTGLGCPQAASAKRGRT